MADWPCAACLRANPSGTKFCGHCGTPREDPAAATGHLAPQDATPDERRLITALFADISGFTVLADKLDPDHLVEIVDPLLRRMGDIVERYEGRVVKFAGDAVLAFFGAPVAHEDDALRAVMCARDMRREVAALVSTLPTEGQHLQLHIGVNTGHAVAGVRGGNLDYSLLGDAVNVAQRLESMAGPGEVLVGAHTRELVGDAFAFESLGPLTLKGKEKPVPAWRLIPDGEDTRPAATREVPALVARSNERARVLLALRRIAGGRSAGVTLVGEPGVGKTRLLQDAAAAAGDLGVTWFGARCLSYGGKLPYWPYAELLRRIAGITSESTAAQARSALRRLADHAGYPEASPYLRELTGIAAGPEDPTLVPPGIRRSATAMRHRTHEAVTSVFAGLAAQGPLVLALEDVHWIDDSSADLTAQLVERCADLPLGLVVTTRPEGTDVAARLHTAGRGDVLTLERLDRDGIAGLVVQFLGEPAADLLDLLEARTDGNPLFVRELTRALAESDALVHTGDRWHLSGRRGSGVPTTIEAVLAGRIDRLTREAAEVLQGAALLGRDVDTDLLRAVLTDERLDIDTAFKILIDHGFLAATSELHRLQFTHALVVDVAYQRLVRRRRRHLHQRVVEAAISLYGDGDEIIDLLAHHAYHGALGRRGLPFVRRAASRAAAVYANTEAIAYLNHAVEMVDDGPTGAAEAASIRMELAELLEHVGDYPSALAEYTAAERDGGGLAAFVGRARVVGILGGGDDAMAVLAEADTRYPAASARDRGTIQVEYGRQLTRVGRTLEATVALEAAVELLRDADPLLRAEAQVALATVLQVIGRDAEALDSAERAIAVFERHGDLPRLTAALRVAAGALHKLGRLDDAAAWVQRGLEIARQTGDGEEEGACLINLGFLHHGRDQEEEALVCFTEALPAFERMGIKGGIAAAYCNLADVLSSLERFDESFAAGLAGLAVAEEIGQTFWITGALNSISAGHLRQARWDEARAAAERCIQLSEEAQLATRGDYARTRLYAAQHHMRIPPSVEELRTLEASDASTAERRGRGRRTSKPGA